MKYTLSLSLLLFALAFSQFAEAQTPVDTTSQLELVSDQFQLADGPAWSGWALFVPDVKGQTLHRYTPKNKQMVMVNGSIGRISASFYNRGELFLSDNANGQVAVFRGNKKHFLTKPLGEGNQLARPNDLVVDRRGGIYFTLTRESQVFYRADTGKTIVAVTNINTPNGITISPDESTLYVASYRPKKIWAYAIRPDGSTANGRIFAEMNDGDAPGADGMTIDRAGNVYCAGATDIWIWNPKGELLGKIKCPTRPINCVFGDSDMRSLYITGFGGLYRQRMLAYGKNPEPPHTEQTQPKNSNRPATTIPEGVSVQSDQVYAEVENRKLLADIALPKLQAKGEAKRPAIVIVHGGGWLNGYKTKFRALSLALASRGYVTMAIEYRLGYEAKFPAAIHDCNAAVRFLRANAKKYGVDPQKIGAVGGSAGGHLVGLMATGWNDSRLQGTGGHRDVSSRLQAAVVMAGPMEMLTGSVAERSTNPQTKSKSNSNIWLGKTVDEARDLYRLADAHVHISKESSPILFLVGEHDKPERNAASRAKLKEHGVWTGLKVYKGGKHGCWNQEPWFDQMVGDMDAFFTAQFESQETN